MKTPKTSWDQPNQDPILGLVRHPSAAPLTESAWLDQRLCTSTLDDHYLAEEIALIAKTEKFRETKNPILAIEAFCVAHEAGVYPPFWVLEYLARAFEKWHAAQGKKSLDNCLGISPKKFKALLAEQRDEMVMIGVAKLVALGLTPKQASTFSAKRLSTSDWNKTVYRQLGNITAETVHDRWKRRWSKVFPVEEIQDWLPKDDKARVEYLKLFPGALKAVTGNRATRKVVVRKKRNRTT